MEQQPQYQPLQPSSTPVKKNKAQLTWALVCLLGPTGLIVITILLYTLVNFIFGATTPVATSDGELFASQSTGNSIVNVILFIVGAISVMAWLPGIIAGIILLATRK